jgi:hypothetical protein
MERLVWGCAFAGKAEASRSKVRNRPIASTQAIRRRGDPCGRLTAWEQMLEITRLNRDYILTTYMRLCNFVSTKSF